MVENVIISESMPDPRYFPGVYEECADDIGIGFSFDGTNFHTPVTTVTPTVVTRTITKLEYMNRFTDMELAMIYTVAKSSIAVEIWLDKFKLAQDINLDDQRTIDGLSAMVSGGLLTEPRMMEILK